MAVRAKARRSAAGSVARVERCSGAARSAILTVASTCATRAARRPARLHASIILTASRGRRVEVDRLRATELLDEGGGIG